MKERHSCPDHDTLLKLLLGKVPAAERERLGAHLLDCDLCSQVAESLSACDEVTDALRSYKSLPEDDDILVQVIERGKELRSELETVKLEETLASETNSLETTGAPLDQAESEYVALLAEPEQPDELGRLGGYRVLELMGVGGMGIVYRAEDPKLKRSVALKVMKPATASNQTAVERFLREAQAAAAIDHDNIITIHQVGEDKGVPFIAMRYLRGESLEEKLAREGRLDPQAAAHLGRQIAKGLAAAHSHGLIHRDIKPANVFIDQANNRAKILDFGLARTHGGDAGLTQSGIVVGTPRYMAPEQAMAREVDHRCDLFSLGTVLYHLVSGTAPFEGGSVTATLVKVSQAECDPILEVCPSLHREFAQLITKLLAKEPDDRPQTAREVADKLADIEEKLDRIRANAGKETVELATATEALADAGPPRKRSLAMFGGGMVAIGLLLWLASGTLFKVETEHGTLVVLVQNADFATTARGRTLKIENVETGDNYHIDFDSPEEAKDLEPGAYEFVVTGGEGFRTKTSRFEIVQGEHQEVEVWWEPKLASDGQGVVAVAATPNADKNRFSWPVDQPMSAIAPFNEAQAEAYQKDWADHLGIALSNAFIIGQDNKGNDVRLTMRLVPPGEFHMGSSAQELDKLLKNADDTEWSVDHITSEGPQHLVRIEQPFLLGEHEVTQVQWLGVMTSIPSHFTGDLNRPVETVSWNEVQSFVAKLNEQNLSQRWEFCLPSEAQWEYACRAGTTDLWYLGGQEQKVQMGAYLKENSNYTTHPVGQSLPNAFGLFDMHGNVWEWCADWWSIDYYAFARVANPKGPLTGQHRVVRGGAWENTAMSCRSANRNGIGPDRSGNGLGFRLAARRKGAASKPVTENTAVAKNKKLHQQESWSRWESDAPKPAIAPFDAEQAKQHQQNWARFLDVPVEQELTIGQDEDGQDVNFSLVLVPPGEFLMGSTAEEQAEFLGYARAAEDTNAIERIPSEGPQHQVRITQPFWIGRYEVTIQQFRQYLSDRNQQDSSAKDLERDDESGGECPASNVSFHDAAAFCDWISNRHPSFSFAVPTEAQWEYACRAGTTSPWNSGFEDFRQYCWMETNAGGKAHPVGQLRSNQFGLYDMHGNVREWCSDRFDASYYKHALHEDPIGPAIGNGRVGRGGRFDGPVRTCRSASRQGFHPDKSAETIGFRVVAVIKRDH